MEYKEQEKNQDLWKSLPGPWPEFAKRYIGPTEAKSDVIIGVRDERLAELFPFETMEEKMSHGRLILEGLSEILRINRNDMNLGVRFDDFETLSAGCPQAVHYTYRYHEGRLEHYYAY